MILKNRRVLWMLIFTLAVAISFWLMSRYPTLGSKAAMSGTEAFEDTMTHQAHFKVPEKASIYTRIFYTTINWYETNWKGMAFGVVIAAAFLTLIGYLPKKPSEQRFKNSLMGMLVGTPLGVCVNCVAPIAKGIYEAGSKMETALAVMFSSPTLNIVVLTMLFSIFPIHMALLKLGATFVLVLLIVPFVSARSKLAPKPASALTDEVCAIDPEAGFVESWNQSLMGAGRDYFTNFKYLVIRTVPLMFLAGFLGAILSHLWSFDHLIGVDVNLKNLAVVSFMGTFLPLPIAFDLMLAQALMMSGLSSGFVTTMLFTLGTFSIYSAMIVYKTFSFKIAVQLYLIICLLGVGVGYLANGYEEYKYVQWLESYDEIVTQKSAPAKSPDILKTEKSVPDFQTTKQQAYQEFIKQDSVSIEYTLNQNRIPQGETPFSKSNGNDWGISYSNTIASENFFDPLFFGRGVASGDLNKDGWTDLAVATDNGFELYQNINGQRFQKLDVYHPNMRGKQGISIALVDLDNDGWLDVYFTAFDGGNHIWLNSLGSSPEIPWVEVPVNDALLTSAPGFGDLNGDGFLDIIHGNYFLGVLTRKPMDLATDYLLTNNNLKFSISPIQAIPGQTHSTLFSDVNEDGYLDLMIGNDYRVADTYHFSQGSPTLKQVKKGEGVIPVTTENTMSIDTGDFNNDLKPDIYLANIGMSRGIDVVSNIFGTTMQNVGKNFCLSGQSILSRSKCEEILKLTTLLNPEKQDMSERCSALNDPARIRECMVTRLTLLATRQNKPELCEKISPEFPVRKTVCERYFNFKPLTVNREEDIPIRSFSNILLLGEEGKPFKDISESTNTTTAEWSWNAKFADLDNDEWQDLYVVNGVLITQEFAPNTFFHNKQGKTFEQAEEAFGLGDRDHSSAYTYIDIENDGDLDIIANTQYGPFKVFINNENKNNSVTFKLRDDRGNSFCIGCKITIEYGEGEVHHQFREIKASGGFRSFDAPLAHFGLARFKEIKSVQVRWTDGKINRFEQPFPANRIYRISRQ